MPFRRIVVFLARRMPIESPAACMIYSLLFVLTASLLLPNAARLARTAPLVADALDGNRFGWRGLYLFQWAAAGAAFLCVGIFQSRCLQLCYPDYFDPYAGSGRGGFLRGWWRRRPGVLSLAGMEVEDDDLRTSILVTGVTGSAKTAGILMPALAQLFQAHNRETAQELSPEKLQKLGAFIPEVKGDLVDGCLYLAHEAGRCVARDFLIISPCCRIPVVRYRDEEGRAWFLSARGGSGGSDAGAFLPGLAFPPGHPRSGRRIPETIFEAESEAEAAWPELKRRPVERDGRLLRFVGWRWRGRRLLRVGHTAGRGQAMPLPGSDGEEQWADPPRRLTVDGLVHIDNGVHYNLVDPRLPPGEAAERITRVAAMVRGTGSRGENDYFYDQARKLIAACIALHRAVEAAPCTVLDIVRLATQDGRLGASLAALESKIAGLKEDAKADPCGDRFLRRLAPLQDLAAYFLEEWRRMVGDGKTATVIKSIVSGAFDVFLRDPDLAETFGRPSTFSFEDVAQSGKIVALVPGERYEQLGRLLGAACKLDFQSVMLARSARPDLNSARLVLYFADECQKYITTGSAAAGDPYFMSLSRSNNVANICATQSYAWIVEVLGREAANVYLSAFGVQFWLQQTDPETCRRAAEICGRVTREKVSAEHSLDFAGVVEAVVRGRAAAIRHQIREEEAERYRPEDFAHLDVGEAIAYNKGRSGRAAKVARGRTAYLFCTRKPEGTTAVSERAREYYREILENLTFERGQSSHWDCRQQPPIPAG